MSKHIVETLSDIERAAHERTVRAETAMAEKLVFPSYGTEFEVVPIGADGKPVLMTHRQRQNIQARLQESPFGHYLEDLVAEGYNSMLPAVPFEQVEGVVGFHTGTVQQRSPSATAIATHDLKKHLRAECQLEGFHDISFEPHPRGGTSKLTSGYHTGMALLDEQGNNLFTNKYLRRHCVDELLLTQADAALLMLPTRGSFDRLAHTQMGPKGLFHTFGKGNVLLDHNWRPAAFESGSVASRVYLDYVGRIMNCVPHHPVYFPTRYLVRSISQRDPSRNHIENRLPGANANEFVVAMTDTVSLERAVQNNVSLGPNGELVVRPHSGKFPTLDMPESIEHAYERFKSSKRMKDMLGEQMHTQLLAPYEEMLSDFIRKASKFIRR